MSRIGKLPVVIPDKVKVEINGTNVKVKGPLGELEKTFPPVVEIVQEGNEIKVKINSRSKFARSMFGTARAVINNMVVGVSTGFTKQLQIEGVGYKADVSGKVLNLSLGYSHPINYNIPENVTIKVERNIITVSSFDKELVGSVAAKIRSFRKPEPYKGKGVKYVDEKIIRKAGKTAK
jgi:large subunit ribosomal protein L6